MKFLQLVAATFLSVSSLLAQEAPVAPSAPNIFIELQIVALPSKEAAPIARMLAEVNTRGDGLKAVDSRVATGEARIVGWSMVTTTSGQSAIVENVREFRYATEYSAGGIGIYYSEGTEQVRKEERNVQGADFHSVPAAFETRNLGVTLEVQPTLAEDGKTIRMNIAPQHSRLNTMRQVNITKEKTGEKVVTEQPEIDVSKTTTTFAMESGSRILLGVFPTTEPKDHIELFILRAEVRGTK